MLNLLLKETKAVYSAENFSEGYVQYAEIVQVVSSKIKSQCTSMSHNARYGEAGWFPTVVTKRRNGPLLRCYRGTRGKANGGQAKKKENESERHSPSLQQTMACATESLRLMDSRS